MKILNHILFMNQLHSVNFYTPKSIVNTCAANDFTLLFTCVGLILYNALYNENEKILIIFLFTLLCLQKNIVNRY